MSEQAEDVWIYEHWDVVEVDGEVRRRVRFAVDGAITYEHIFDQDEAAAPPAAGTAEDR